MSTIIVCPALIIRNLRFLILLFTLLFPSILFASHYYVDSISGSNLNNGLTPGSAWKSISKINNINLIKGDTISFRSGLRYSGNTLRIRYDNLTFNSYGPGNKPVLDGKGMSNCVELKGHNNIRFINLKFVNGYPRDITLNGCRNIIIDSCNVDSCAGMNIFQQNIYSGQGSRLIIRYSTISYAGAATGGGHGIYIDGTDSTLLEYDTLISNKNNNIRIGYGYTKPYYTDNLIIRYCIIKYAGDQNISDDGSRESKFYYNILENDTTGWSVNISLFEQNGYHPERNDYFNNTFIIHDYGKDNAGIYIHTSDSILFMNVYNNIFYLTNTRKGWAIYSEDNIREKWNIDYNLYYSNKGFQNHVWHWGQVPLHSSKSWRRKGFDKKGIFKNPLFTDYKNEDYTISKDSPARKSAIGLGITKDGKGNIVPLINPDIGAFQYVNKPQK